VAGEHHLLAVTVSKAANRIASARLAYADGAAASGEFPLSGGELFLPGRRVEILAGPASDQVSLFTGIVVRQSLKLRDRSTPQLVVECRHGAVKLTVGAKNRYFHDQTDSDIITTLLQGAGVEAEVESTSVTHKQLVQYECTDWDFLLMRAEANGLLVFTGGEQVAVKAPVIGANPVCTLLFGATILEMDVQMEARGQYGAVTGVTWDASAQELVEKEASDPGLTSPGNHGPSDLAEVVGLDTFRLQHGAVAAEEAQAWADAQWLKSQLSRISGRIKCEGIGTVNPGAIVALSGVGDRYNGNAYVSGVRHDFDLVQGWKTHLQFGGLEAWLGREQTVSAPKAGALVPGINGLQLGVVTGNEDPDGEHRVRVRMPLVSSNEDGTWCRVASVDAGDERGFFFRPEIGDEVVLGFVNDDPRQAVILGMLHSSAKAAPLAGSDDNNEKMYQSRSKMKLGFNDETKVIRLETPGGNTITLSEDDKGIAIVDQNQNKLTMNDQGITIESSKAIILKATTEFKIEASNSCTVKSSAELKMEGAAGVELSSSAVTKIKGSLVQIN
jgi:Rhs element Vgr protein